MCYLTVIGPIDDSRSEMPGLSIENKSLKKGDVHSIDFYAKNIDDIIALQAAIKLDISAVKVNSKTVGSLTNFPAENVSLEYLDQGLVSLIWYNSEAIKLNNNHLVFSLEIEALDDIDQMSDVIALTEELIIPQSYGSSTEPVGFDLVFDETTVSNNNLSQNDFKLLDNRPNPFSETTTIGFTLPEFTTVKMSVIDASGKVVWTAEQKYDKGYQEVNLNSDELGNASGIFYFQLETSERTAHRKMIRIPN